MRIAIDTNGVLRDTIQKIIQVYEKNMIINTEKQETFDISNLEIPIAINDSSLEFQYAIKKPITSLKLRDFFNFIDDNELYNFLYEEFPMEIFGHAPSYEMNTFNYLNDFYIKNRDQHEILVVSDEIGKSKPSTLFFLSKFGCLVEKIKFFSNSTINSLWDEVDVLLTANPDLLLSYPKDKIVIKFKTDYNTDIQSNYIIESLSELDDKLEKIIKC